MLLGRFKDRASCDSREIQHGDRSSVSLFLVYNDMLFFLVFNTLSLQNFKRGGIRCRVLSSVSLLLVYNDVLFFLVFDYISFFCFLAALTVADGAK